MSNQNKMIRPLSRGLHGDVAIPGDKSISHRSIMLSSLADSEVHITNFLHAQDCLSTAKCFAALGTDINFLTDTELTVKGHGLHGLHEAAGILDAGNSGTTLRLMLGMMAAQPFLTTFTGDASLSQRPMGRVIKPLTAMGARIYGREQNTKLPITVVPVAEKLQGMTYESPVASAQVKSALLLAGLYAEGATTVVEPYVSRNHTERMLAAFGVMTEREGTAVTVRPVANLTAPAEIEVPGDISSAAYWLVAGSIIPGSHLCLHNVGVNETRTGILEVLENMGASLELRNRRESCGEAAADIIVTASHLHGVTFGGSIMPRLIDEVPVIAAAAMLADGDTVINDAGELRVKETDRLQAIHDEFNKVAPGSVEIDGDTMIIHGGCPCHAAEVSSYDDHRMAMSLAILGAATAGVTIRNGDCVNISYPEFYDTLARLAD